MSKEVEINKQALWWTSVIVAITTTVIDNLFYIINKSVNSEAYAMAKGYFSSSQPDYFPLLYLVFVFCATLVTVWLYSLLLPRMPENWIVRGLIVGIILYIVADIPDIVRIGYTTNLPGAATRGMAMFALLGSLANGCILTYFHGWISGERKKK